MDTVAIGFEKLCEVCADVGVAFEGVTPEVRSRMHLLAAHTETVEDCTRIAGMARQVFRYYDEHKPELRFSELERRIVVIGSLFSDIGKTGPSDADEEDQQMIVEMFAVEGVRDDQQSVRQFLQSYFADDAARRVARFSALRLNPQMKIRDFWNLHAGWTLDIVRGGGVPTEAVAAAASHHLLENINPRAIVAEDGRFSTDFGDNTGFDRAEKLVILLDKYDAIRRRSHGTHAQAIEWLRDLLSKHPTFRADLEFAALLDDVDAALGPNKPAGQGTNAPTD